MSKNPIFNAGDYIPSVNNSISNLENVVNLNSLNIALIKTNYLQLAGTNTLSGLTNILEISEAMSSITISSNIATCSYSLGAVFYLTGQTANFLLALTNLPTILNRTISITLIINSSTSKFYATTLNINGVAVPVINWNGGLSNINVSSASYIIQQFNIINNGTTTIIFSSVSQFY